MPQIFYFNFNSWFMQCYSHTNEIGLCLVTATEQVVDGTAATAVEFKQRGDSSTRWRQHLITAERCKTREK